MTHKFQDGDCVRLVESATLDILLERGFCTRKDRLEVVRVDAMVPSDKRFQLYWVRNPSMPEYGELPVQACMLSLVAMPPKED